MKSFQVENMREKKAWIIEKLRRKKSGSERWIFYWNFQAFFVPRFLQVSTKSFNIQLHQKKAEILLRKRNPRKKFRSHFHHKNLMSNNVEKKFVIYSHIAAVIHRSILPMQRNVHFINRIIKFVSLALAQITNWFVCYSSIVYIVCIHSLEWDTLNHYCRNIFFIIFTLEREKFCLDAGF